MTTPLTRLVPDPLVNWTTELERDGTAVETELSVTRFGPRFSTLGDKAVDVGVGNIPVVTNVEGAFSNPSSGAAEPAAALGDG